MKHNAADQQSTSGHQQGTRYNTYSLAQHGYSIGQDQTQHQREGNIAERPARRNTATHSTVEMSTAPITRHSQLELLLSLICKRSSTPFFLVFRGEVDGVHAGEERPEYTSISHRVTHSLTHFLDLTT